MKIFAISDTHFNHVKLIEYGRPVNFAFQILRNLRNAKGDLLIHCGDFAIGEDEKAMKDFVEATRDFKKKILVRGNHDKKSDLWYMERGFDFVCDRFSTMYFGKKFLFTHEPYIGRGDFYRNIHGHLHGNAHRLTGELKEAYNPDFHYDLAPELRNYSPVNLEKIV